MLFLRPVSALGVDLASTLQLPREIRKWVCLCNRLADYKVDLRRQKGYQVVFMIRATNLCLVWVHLVRQLFTEAIPQLLEGSQLTATSPPAANAP